MKRLFVLLLVALVGATLGPLLAAQASWSQFKLAAPLTLATGDVIPAGTLMCKDSASGALYRPPYTGKSDVSKSCNTLTSFIPWLGTAEAAVIVLPAAVVRQSQPNTPTPTLHAPWSECDVGSPPTAGVATNGAGEMLVTGAGDVGSNNNNNVLVTHIAYQAWSGDVDVVSQVKEIQGGFDWKQGGIIFTDTACNNSLWVAGSVSVEQSSPQQGVGFHLNGTVNGRATSYATAVAGAQPPPQWIRLSRSGSVVTFYYGSSSTGPWTRQDSETLAFSDPIAVGMYCTTASTTDPALSTCKFIEPIVTAPGTSAGTLSFSQSTLSVVEDAGTFTACANRSGGTSGAVSAHVHNAGGGSATGSDWTTGDLDQTLSWADGDGAQKCTTGIHVTNRSGTQGTRTINLALTSLTGGATAGSPSTLVVSILDAQTFTGQKKWHPGYYVMVPRNATAKFNQSTRFAYYDGEANSTFKGWNLLTVWAQLEGATHGDYTAADARLLAEIAHLKGLAKPKRFSLQLDDEMYGGDFSWYPAYLVTAGCVFQELWSDGVHYLYHFKWWLPTCANYYADLVTHLGALLDSEPYFENLTLDYEQALNGTSVNGGNGSEFNRTGFMNGVATVFTAAAAAFPHTNLSWRGNWGVTFHEADQVQEIGIAKPLGIGIGSEDACSIDPDSRQNVYGTYPIYQDMQNVFAGYGGYDSGHHAGTYTDQRGKMFSIDAVEDSELGYNSVCNGQGFAGYATVANGLRAAGYMSLYDEHNAEWATHSLVEYNTWVGASVQRWSVGTTGSLWDMVTNHPLTHTACPTDYDTLFGNGTPGSGCNTQ